MTTTTYSWRLVRLFLAACVVTLTGACATAPPFDYTAFKQSRPKSLLVLPPVNDTPEVKATNGVMATATFPLAEAGYYVMPVSLVDETFKRNGLTQPADIQQVPVAKLHDIFGADAALYMHVTDYGAKYMVVGSDTRVTIDAKLVDLRTGTEIWSGKATASSQEGNNNQGGLIGLLVSAIVQQVISTASDSSFRYAAVANQRLLGPGMKNGLLWGPRSPNYDKPQ